MAFDILEFFTRRIHGAPSWPPLLVKADWEQRQQWRRRFVNDWGEMLQHTERFHPEHRKSIYTPVPMAREMARLSAALLFSDPVKVTLPNEEEEARRQRNAKRQAEKDKRNPFLDEAEKTPAPEEGDKAVPGGGDAPPKPPSKDKPSGPPSKDKPEIKDKPETPAQAEEDPDAETKADEILLGGEPPKSPLQIKLEELLEANGIDPFLQESAEKIASEGRGAIRVIRDPEVADNTPYLTWVAEDQCLWDVRYGRAIVGGVAIFEVAPLDKDGNTKEVYRLFEEHTTGHVERKVYKGTTQHQGKVVPPGEWPEEWKGMEVSYDTGLDVSTLIRWENVPGGYSDIAGLDALLDNLNESESLMLDKGRKSIPHVFADRTLSDEEGKVDLEGVILTGDPNITGEWGANVAKSVEVAQPELQTEAHIAWIDHVREMIATHAGYSSASWGIGEEGRTDSGTALQLRQARTLLTRSGKERMATEAITNALAVALAWYVKNGSEAKTKDFRPDVMLGNGLPTDPVEKANELSTRKSSGIVSLRQAVREQHPDWTEDQVDEEVDLIEGDTALPPMLEAAMNPQLNPNSPFAGDEDEGEGEDEEQGDS